MKLHGKKILVLVADGAEYGEVLRARQIFEQEGATVFITAPTVHMTIETVDGHRAGGELLLDFPIEAVDPELFDALILPSGLLAAQALQKNEQASQVITAFHNAGRPICASGEGERLVGNLRVVPRPLILREGDSIDEFLIRSVQLVIEGPASSPKN